MRTDLHGSDRRKNCLLSDPWGPVLIRVRPCPVRLRAGRGQRCIIRTALPSRRDLMRVLIADDDPIARHLLARTLAGWGYEVTAASDGAEAWRLFLEGDFALVVLDWVMPGMDGPEIVR